MKKIIKISSTIAGFGLILSGCATTNSSFDSFQAQNLNDKVNAGYLNKNFNNLLVIVDSSSSMAESYDAAPFSGASKFAVEKEIVSRINQTLPNTSLNAGLRSFGSGTCSSWVSSNLNQEMSRHAQGSFASALDTMTCTGGGSPMHRALADAGDDLASVSGKTAVLVISDAYELDRSPIPAAKALAAQYGDNLCIYGVWVGNQKEHSGRYLLQQMSDVSGCGFVTSASEIAASADMANFVSRMLLTPAIPALAAATTYAAPFLDADTDGIADSSDNCPDTPSGAIVNKGGCWSFHGVFFDFNKATIKDKYHSMFANAVKVMNLNPGLTVQIEGHTDNIGSAAYNLKLSERRAQAVKDHLVSMGIDPDRMTIKGLGFSDPVASNETEAGRAENRRVYFSRTDR